jgi:hypothetical protein
MGYPNKRVEMTDVHGEPQQGGYLPAEIWHTDMAPVTEGHPCATLKESSAGIVYAPFYGKYAATGLALAEKEAAAESKSRKHGAKKSPGAPAAGERKTGAPTPPSATEPAGPPAPTVNKTGGAGPG